MHDGRNLLARFGEEPQAEPLFVSEGTARHKVAAIARSGYLTYVYDQLVSDPGPFVLFGAGLSSEDAHIASALNRNDLNIAIGLHGDDPTALKARAAGYVKLLPRPTVVFFRAATHPLGEPGLAAKEPENEAAPEVVAAEICDESDNLAS